MSDDLRDVAFNPAAPAGERYDANAELSKAHMPTASDIIPRADLLPLINHVAQQYAEADMMRKSTVQLIDFPMDEKHKPNGMQSVYLDPLGIFSQSDYFEKPSPIGFDSLRQMVYQTPILNSIMLKRLRQVARFCQPSGDGTPGFEISHVDPKREKTAEDDEACAQLTKFVVNCGWEFNPRKRKLLRRDNFKSFMTKHYADSLMMDAAPIETEMKRDAKLGMDGFYAVDGSTVRLCSDDGYRGDAEVFAVQVVGGRLTAAYPRDALIYEVRNPRADVRLAGYGMAEPELLIRVVTGFLNAMAYNINGFDKNSIPKGLLSIIGDYGPDDQAALKRYWNATVKGINNAWSLPIMFAKDIQSKATFEKFGVEFNEVMFAKFMTLMTSLATAIYGMDPAEINFDSFTSASSNPLSGSDTEARLTSAKDSGLRSDMGHFESEMSDYVISAFDEKLCLPVGGPRPGRPEIHRRQEEAGPDRQRDARRAAPAAHGRRQDRQGAAEPVLDAGLYAVHPAAGRAVRRTAGSPRAGLWAARRRR